MQRKLVLMIVAGILCLTLAGCGQSGDTQPEEEDPVQSQQPVDESSEADSSEEETQGPADPEAPETAQYTDNFSVDEAAVTAFAEQIQTAVADKDLEALADLAAYPLYVGFADGGQSVERLFRWRGICGVPGGPDRTGSGPDLLRRAGL